MTMKRTTLISITLVLCVSLFAQNYTRIPLIGEKAPDFQGESTNGTINFPEDFGSSWKVILSHPKDFTPVCTSELLELARMQNDFKVLGVNVIVLSTDNLNDHYSWIAGMEKIKQDGRDPVKIDFPLVDDHTARISYKYGMLHETTSTTRDVRGVFIIDPDNVIRSFQFYPIEMGRNMLEIKRSIIALQTSDRNDVHMPVNWEPGNDVLLYHYDKKALESPDVYQLSWFLTYKKLAD